MKILKKDNGLIIQTFKNVFMTFANSIVIKLITERLLPPILHLYNNFNLLKISLQIKVLITLLIAGLVIFLLYRSYIYFYKKKKSHSRKKLSFPVISSFSKNSNDFELDPKKVKKNVKKSSCELNSKSNSKLKIKNKFSYETLLSSNT